MEESVRSCDAVNVGARNESQPCDEAFSALVHRQSQFVFRVVFSVVRNVQDAEDVVQETFLKIYRLGGWKDIRDERAFLARAAWRLAVRRIRPNRSEQVLAETADSTPNAEQSLMKEDAMAQLHRLLDALPLELRLPLALSTVDDMTSPQIAKVMGIPEGTVRTRLLRARAILRKKLEELDVRRG